jgi:hypothetical protein
MDDLLMRRVIRIVWRRMRRNQLRLPGMSNGNGIALKYDGRR